MSLLDSRQRRGRDDRRIRSSLEASQRYYRPQYGRALTPTEMKKEGLIEQAYNERAERVRAAIAQEKKQFNEAVSKSRAQMRAAQGSGGVSTSPLRVIDYNKATGERRVVKQYTLPAEYVKQLHTESFGTGKKGTPWGAFNPDGSYNVETYVHGGGNKKYEKDIVSSLDKAQAQYNEALRLREREMAAQRAQQERLIAKERQKAEAYWGNAQNRASNAYNERNQQKADRFLKRREENSSAILGIDDGLLSSVIGVQL